MNPTRMPYEVSPTVTSNPGQRVIMYKIYENLLVLNIVDIKKKKNRKQIVPVLIIRILWYTQFL